MRKYIPTAFLVSIEDHWAKKASRSPLPFRTRKCGDCAIDFYGEIVTELKKQPEHIQKGVAASWFCHNTCTHACKGAVDEFINK